jgi:hypothetical protein
MIFAAFIAIIPACFIAVLALSKKTSSAVRKASIIALMLICLTFIICTIFLFAMFGYSTGRSAVFTDIPIEPVQETRNTFMEVLIPSIVVLFLMILVIILALREQRRK